ncbi:sulfite exporter TauE/SafE family protein [Sulfuricurvum sp.]|uniref:sulfite exporter TauE/SafE family protein n=1 Tax=Sulfuricurvum sp. TaxID=2025608 RepID=UPI002634926A|nr:sulfite exporter TauE/SafE family protein [Sulfuricurvum sp.]MDD2267787.1 sulfite exporter TauE/SafE family protein [Sulfuricurvum sp.]MDD2784993.1 sulfite exporter TauE/SafE family protein [Sulfuricurvum sp.]
MSWAIFVAIGLSSGILAGIFGIGGGVLIVPALMYIAGFSQKLAIGTSLAVLLPPIGLAAVLEYYRNGNVDFKAALVIASMALIGGWIGARIDNQIDAHTLKIMFGVFLIFMGGYMIFEAK